MTNMIRHSKIKNTGILFELLTRQITVDVLNNNKNLVSVDLVRKYFSEKTELGKEWQLYSILLSEIYKSERKAERLIDTVIKARQKLHNSVLRREKYNLIKEIKKHFEDTIAFFDARLPNYKVYASIYKLFQSESSMEEFNPVEVVGNRYTIVEYILREKKSQRKLIENISDGEERDLRLLAYSILVDKFNKKYKSLNSKQKNLLREYINNISNTNGFKAYINEEVQFISKNLKRAVPNVTDKVTRIKLQEAINQLNLITKGKIVKDKQVVALMRYYQLEKELHHAIND